MTQPRITRDRDDIEAWADEHGAVPVREGDRISLVNENELTETHERLDWDEFHRHVDEEDHVVTYHGETEERESFEVNDRDTAIERVASESEEYDRDQIEQRLVEGETITGTITETTVVEKTIVEQATLESEVVDRETVEQDVVDVRLVDRECQACDVTAETADFDYAGTYGTDRFMTDDVPSGTVEEYPFDVTVEVREDWAVTIEQRDRYTVETHITDVDVSETDEVEGRDLQADIDVESVHRQLLESGVIGVDVDAEEGEVIDTETYDIESEFTDDDVITTYLTSRQRFERELSDRSRLTTEVVDSELLDREIVREEDIETDLVERGATDTESVTATETTTDVETTDAETTEVETDTDVETGTEARTDEYRAVPEADDEGKRVVNESGDELGEVIDVDDGVAYVDPHPSLTERVMSRLGFDEDEDIYRLPEDKIDRITDDEIVVSQHVLDEDTR